MEENSACAVLENNQQSYPLTAVSSYVCWYMSVCECVCVCVGGWRVTSCRQHMVHPLKKTDIVPSCRDGKLENGDENNESQLRGVWGSAARDLSLCRLQLLCYTDRHTYLNVSVFTMPVPLFLDKDYFHIDEKYFCTFSFCNAEFSVYFNLSTASDECQRPVHIHNLFAVRIFIFSTWAGCSLFVCQKKKSPELKFTPST